MLASKYLFFFLFPPFSLYSEWLSLLAVVCWKYADYK